LLWSNLKAPNLDPNNPPTNTTITNGIKIENSIDLDIECATNPLMEFVNINRLAVAAACLGSPKPVNIRNGDNHIPPPIPTILAIKTQKCSYWNYNCHNS
jgi:hypothetical protein